MKFLSKQIIFLGLASLCVNVNASAAVSGSQAVKQTDADSGYIKPHAPVDVRHKVLGTAVPGQPVDVEITLVPGRMAEAVSAEFRTDEGMRESRRSKAERVAVKGSPMAVRQVVTFVPSVEGLHYITVFANVQVEGRNQGRAMAIPVQVGASRVPVRKMAEPMGEEKANPEGGTVRVMSAKQTIRESETEQ